MSEYFDKFGNVQPGKGMVQAQPAATLILWRDGPPPRILMIERAATMAFAAGAMAFPGGRVDPDDWSLPREGLDRDDSAARLAAIRETIEEVGIAVGLSPPPTRVETVDLRKRLAEGASFSELLADLRCAADYDALIPFARWRPPRNGREARIFDTRFYLALAPAGADPVADIGECTSAVWITPQEVLDDGDAGSRRIIFPTRRNLERLALLSTFEAAKAHIAQYPVRLIQTVIEHREDGDWMCIADSHGYPVTGQPMAGMTRG